MAGVLEQIQHQLEEVTVAIRKLNERVSRLEQAEAISRGTNALDSKSHCNEKPARESGYVNWDESHDPIKNMLWVDCNSLIGAITFGQPDYLPKFTITRIDEDTRFPQDDIMVLYVNISDPKLLYEIQYHKALYLKPENRYQILTLIEKHMHTRYSFEDKYKLRWVEAKEQDSDIKEDKNEKEPQISG